MRPSIARVRAAQEVAAWQGPRQAEAFIRKLVGRVPSSSHADGWIWMRKPNSLALGVPIGFWNLVGLNVREWGPDAEVLFTPALCSDEPPGPDRDPEVVGLVGLVARIPLRAHPRGPQTFDDVRQVLAAGHPFSILVDADDVVEVYWRFGRVWWLADDAERHKAQALAAHLHEMLQGWGEREGIYVDADVRLGGWCHLPGTRCGDSSATVRIVAAFEARWAPEKLEEGIRQWTPHNVGTASLPSVVVSPQTNDWQLPGAPPFPVKVFPDVVADFVLAVARAKDAPVDYVAAGVLGAASAVIGNARMLVVKPDFVQPAMLWLVAVGPPGSAKSPALKEPLDPVYAIEQKLQAANEKAKADYEKALADWERLPARQRPPRPKAPTPRELVVEDATIEAISKTLAANPRGVVQIRDELGGMLLDMARYTGAKSGERQTRARIWSGMPAKVNRVKFEDPRFVARPYLAVVSGLQPALLPELLSHEHSRRARGAREVVDDGFIDRFLFFYPEPKVPGWSDVSVPDQLRRHYHQLIGRLYRLEPEARGGQLRPRPVVLDAAARARFAEWVRRNTREATQLQEQGSPLAGPWAKLPQQLARLTLCLHELWRVARYVGKALPPDFAVTDEPVNAETVERAIRLVEAYVKPHLRRVYQELDRGPAGAKIERILQLARKKGRMVLSARDIYTNEWAGIKTASEAQAVLRALVDRGLGYFPDDSGRVQLYE